MDNSITLNKLEENLELIKKMYDLVRLVDPVKKAVIQQQEGGFEDEGSVCYDYWKNGRICDNCISVRAHLENKSFVKLEQNPDAIMVVTAVPVERQQRPVVLELLKNATHSMMLGTGDYNEGLPMRGYVDGLNTMLTRDDLTHLYNRRFADERLPADIVKAAMEDSPLTLIFLDVDNLKQVNDTYGHNAGDKVLKSLGGIIKSCIREGTDWAARYGGDEFIICLGKTGSQDAMRIAKRIRDGAADIKANEEDETSFGITVSMGVHTISKPCLSAEEVINKADRNMYNAKRQGKNSIFADQS
ncbi:MAG: GGDEF domain-containing protein [Christensenellales bacterium]|jgi:two-component system cell cycle response regulator